jgi:Ca2+-binding RTX toxin-like protein
VGGEGVDIYDGGPDNPDEFDAISFRDETGGGGVYANLDTGQVTDTYGNSERATGIEEVDGSANDDILIGNAADNFFRGGDGADSYDGAGGGFDQVSFDNETGGTGAVVDLGDNTVPDTDTYGNIETFVSIEVLRGSQWADHFVGDANDNTFRGLAGDDYIDGGGGWDEVRYDRDANSNGDDGVTVDLANGSDEGTAVDGFGDTDTLINIEGVRGTQSVDSLTGNDSENELRGLGGNDALFGEAGDDQLFGDDGNDTLTGGEGADQLTGGDGADEFVFLADTDGTLEVDQILDYESADLINLDDLLSPTFEPDNWNLEKSLVDAGGGNSTLQVGGEDVATLFGVDSATDTINVIFDHTEVIAISNVGV